MTQADHQVQLVITDDGRGFDPARIADGHIGLGSCIARVTAAGGQLVISSPAAGGTTTIVTLPTSGPQTRRAEHPTDSG